MPWKPTDKVFLGYSLLGPCYFSNVRVIKHGQYIAKYYATGVISRLDNNDRDRLVWYSFRITFGLKQFATDMHVNF